jgi:hypothetical protein
MGYKFHERVDIDDSDCGGIYTRTDVYSTVPILVDRYPDPLYDQCYFKDGWQPVPGTIYGKLKYDSSFEWIHKVIERIESLGYYTMISYRRGGEGNFHEMLILDKDQENHIIAETLYRAVDEDESIAIAWINEAEKKTKLEAMYRAVVNFIKYYNQLNERSNADYQTET